MNDLLKIHHQQCVMFPVAIKRVKEKGGFLPDLSSEQKVLIKGLGILVHKVTEDNEKGRNEPRKNRSASTNV